jgi:hypothetical protein
LRPSQYSRKSASEHFMISMTAWAEPTKDAAIAIRREAVFGSSLGTTIMRVLRVHTFFVRSDPALR